jgi:arsenical pump membrane protein
VAAALGVLAAAAARNVGLAPLVTGSGPVAVVRATGVAAALAAIANNLPAVLVLRPLLPPGASDALWAVLLGVNIAPLVLVTGSLAGLLWSDVLRRLGAEVGPREFSRVGVLVGLPALAVALAVLVATTVLR